MRTYRAQITDFATGSNIPVLAINNPTSSECRLIVRRVESTHPSSVSTASYVLRRYSSLATGGTALAEEPGDTSPRVIRYDSSDASASFIALTGSFAEPSNATLDEWFTVVSRSGDASARKDFDRPLVVGPGESVAITLIDSDFTETSITVEIDEDDQTVSHAASSVLPVAGAFSAWDYYDIPGDRASLTFFVAYTAAIGSTNARPKVRVSWGDGVTTVLQPIVDATIDVSASPVASRNQYALEQRYPSAVSAGASVSFAVPIDVLPGARSVRLDVAELGDAANPGTVTVTIVGR